MLATPNNWESLWELDSTLCTYKLVIGENTYTGKDDIEGDTLKFYKTLFSPDALVGNTPCFSMECCIRMGNTEIPKGAMLTAYVALKNGDIVTDYIPMGTFKVYRRTEYLDGWVKLTCRDKMQMANQSYFSTALVEGEWPKAMTTVIEETAARIGIEIDPRTKIQEGPDWVVYPPTTKSIRQVWSYIAAAHAGNFLITPEDKLLLVTPKMHVDEAVEAACSADGVEFLGEAVYVDRVDLVVDSATTISSGTSGTNNISIDCPYGNETIAKYVKSQLTGILYYPVKVSNMVVNPALEIQDTYLVDGVPTTWGTLDLVCGIVPVSSGTAENLIEPDNEYGFEDTPTNDLTIKIEEAKSYADDAVKRQTQQDIYNKLTNNGQAQGLFLSANGQLFVNANFISTGILASQDGTTFYLDLDKGILDLNARKLTIAGQTIEEISLEGLTQEEVFNKLTNEGKLPGIFMRDGQLYVNADYIGSGTLNASLIKAGTLQSNDEGETFNLDLDKGTFSMSGTGKFMSPDGKSYITIEGDTFILYAKEGEYGEFKPIARIGFSEDSEGYDYPYMLMGNDDNEDSSRLGLVKQFANGIYIGNSAPKLSTGNFVGLVGAVGFFIDTKEGRTYNVVDEALFDSFSAVFA